MVFSLLTRITNNIFIELIIKREIVLAKNLAHYSRRRVAKSAVPTGRRNLVEGEGTLIFGRESTRRVESPLTPALKQGFLRCSILDKKRFG
jgi:hypothetical protein